MKRTAAAAVTPVRQRSQYSCMAASLMMCINAHGRDFDEDTVNKVMGAQPMQGASWESAIAAAQHFGFRIHMVVPATVKMLKEWTDQGIPVMIAWNPEGRPWSHASVVFDVKEDGTVLVADPNIPDPDETVRTVSKDEFYHKWFEKAENYLVRRPAMAIMPEITSDGRQVVASTRIIQKTAFIPQIKHQGSRYLVDKTFFDKARKTFTETTSMGSPRGGLTIMTSNMAEGDVYLSPEKDQPGWYLIIGKPGPVEIVLKGIGASVTHAKVAKAPTPVNPKKKDDGHTVHVKMPHPRDDVAKAIAEKGGIPGTGAHHNREDAFEKGRSRKTKYPPKWDKESSADHLADRYMEKNHG